MDTLDYEILECLRNNSREKASAISRKINLSVSAVLERIHKMEQAGIIEGYTVLTDQRQLGKGMQAVVEVSLEHPKYYDIFVRQIGGMQEVATCYYLTGEYDFLLKVYAADTRELETIHRRIKGIHGVGNTRTSITLTTVKEQFRQKAAV